MVKLKRITKKVLFAKTVQLLQPKLRLEDWKIVVRFLPKTRPNNIVAYCQPMPEYKSAGIRVNMTRLAELNHYEVVSTAIHEMLHCVTWSMTEWAEQLCRKDKQKLEVTRKLDEGIITHLERMLTDITLPQLQKELTAEGYANLDTAFDSFKVMSVPTVKAAKKKPKKKIKR